MAVGDGKGGLVMAVAGNERSVRGPGGVLDR